MVVARQHGWADALDISLNLHLEVGEVGFGVVVGVERGVLLQGKVVDLSIEFVELRQEAPEVGAGGLDAGLERLCFSGGWSVGRGSWCSGGECIGTGGADAHAGQGMAREAGPSALGGVLAQ